jgi:cell division protein FtsB
MGKLIRFRRKGKAAQAAERALFPPFQAGATDARPAAFATDAAATAGVARPGTAPDPSIVRKQVRNRFGAIVAFVFLFVASSAAALFGTHGYLDVRRQRVRLLELQASTEAHQQRVEALRREIDRLKTDPFAVERIAREDLGYVAPGEVTLLLPGDEEDGAHGLDAKGGSGIVPAVRSTP